MTWQLRVQEVWLTVRLAVDVVEKLLAFLQLIIANRSFIPPLRLLRNIVYFFVALGGEKVL